MKRKKVFWAAAAVILFALLLVLILAVLNCFYFMVNFRIYARNASMLDLRDKEISVQEYEKIQREIPGCDILWNVPFQGKMYSSDTEELTVSSLTEEDVVRMDCFPKLKTVHAEECTDYPQLLALEARHPEAELMYDVRLNGESFSRTAMEVTVSGIGEEEIPFLACLPQLETVSVCGGSSTDHFDLLQAYCKEKGISFCIEAAGKRVKDSTENLTLKNVDDEEINLLAFLPELKQVRFINPEASADRLLQLRQDRPETAVSWEQEICGKTFSDTEEEIDLSECEIENLSQVEEGMTYFPNAKQVFLGECGIDNEEIAAYRERVRPEYKVVWIVRCGEKLPTRTDATSFMPARDGVGYFRDKESYNLRYCEDMIAIDVGHMGVRDISFVAFMPNLKYLILAHTEVSDITPISNCKNLVFLELDWSPVKDYTPLQGCTALEDLNIGKYGGDVTPICEMTWLKNVWAIFRKASASKLAAALPNTRVVSTGNATVASGWRNLPNYFAMRDALGMYYMSW